MNLFFEVILREDIFEGNILLAETYCYNLSGRQDSNLRPSAPKTPHSSCTALGFQAISDFLLGSTKFVMTNKAIFVRNLSAIYLFLLRNFNIKNKIAKPRNIERTLKKFSP